jgi:hypothetical protein
MCTQDDLDLVRADEDGMIDRREDEGHPVNTDPPLDGDRCPCGGYWQVFENGTFCKDCDRRKGRAKYLAEQARIASQYEAASGVGYEEERLAGMAQTREHYTDLLTGARWKKALEKIAELANHPPKGFMSALLDIHNTANAALEIPPVGTRVRCLLPHRGEFGTIVAWDHALGRPLAAWDSLPGQTPEAIEPHEFTIDLNQED